LKFLLLRYLKFQKKKKNDGGPKRFVAHPKYKAFQQKVWRVHHPNEAVPGEDSEFVLKTTQDNLKCPITRKMLENPVTNKSCGHHYSKDAILEMMRKSKKGAQCPVSGCSAKVTVRSLEDDKDVELLVQRELLKHQKKNSELEDDEDIIDV